MEPRFLAVPIAAILLTAAHFVYSAYPARAPHEIVPPPEEGPVPNSGVEIVGSIAYGERRDIAYTNPPKYRALAFKGARGEDVIADAAASTTSRRAVAWIADDAFHRWEFPAAESADGVTQVSLTLPESGTYYVVVREAELRDATFSISIRTTRSHIATK